MLAKINSWRAVFLFLVLALAISGCTPAGPRALLKGKKYLERGDVADAVIQLKRATTLLATNAQAWNYYGVALQRAGQPDEAVAAYQTALKLDRDLIETHYNLGCLALEQSRPDLAKSEFTAYTLRRPNEAAGWLKLAAAQMKAGDVLPAERSFSTVLALKTSDAEAFNGLGLARLQRGKPRDAAQFFYAAIQSRADYAPALLNLATVNHQYLHDSKAALENYHAYLALKPRPANYDDVKTLVGSLEQSDVATTVMTPALVNKTSAPPEIKPKTGLATTGQHLAVASHPEPVENSSPRVAPHTNAGTVAVSPPPVKPATTTQTVEVPAETPIVTVPKTNLPPTNPPVVKVAAPPVVVTNPAEIADNLEVPMPEEQPRRGFFRRLFGSKTSTPKSELHGTNLTPIPANTDEMSGTKPAEEKPANVSPPPKLSFPRYHYTYPVRPATGDRRAAAAAFTKAQLAEKDEKWPDALHWYQAAAESDPSWFEAEYNTGVIAYRLRNFPVALTRYELALALTPDSVDARYNFALALKAASYVPDAADELKRILVVKPDEVRAHLALAKICAQSLHDNAQARRHYLKVLELDPDNQQAADIRFWLSANAQ